MFAKLCPGMGVGIFSLVCVVSGCPRVGVFYCNMGKKRFVAFVSRCVNDIWLVIAAIVGFCLRHVLHIHALCWLCIVCLILPSNISIGGCGVFIFLRRCVRFPPVPSSIGLISFSLLPNVIALCFTMSSHVSIVTGFWTLGHFCHEYVF